MKELSKKQRSKMHKLLNEECNAKMEHRLIDKFLDLGEPIIINRRECLLRAGEFDDNIYVLVEGITRIWYNDGEKEVTYAFGMPGTLSQSFHCSVMKKPCAENIEACSKSLVLKISRNDFNKLLEEEIDFVKWNMHLYAFQLFLFERRRYILNGSTIEKYNILLRSRPEIFQKVPLKIIASYLGVTPSYLSRLRKTVQNDSISRDVAAEDCTSWLGGKSPW